ncbi:MAG: hypothetical protein J7J61_11210 [Candidatus Hydrothermae bacterium]|nr:hypothetical protein [Candidatus Hydrothermae bacterium]
MEPVLWKGKRKLLDRKNLRTSPKVAIPRWWTGEGEEEVYVEIHPNFILICRLDFEHPDEVLKRFEGGVVNAGRVPLQKG